MRTAPRFLVLAALAIALGVLALEYHIAASSSQQVSMEDLQDGDLAVNRSPPFIPGLRIQKLIGRRVCVAGEVWSLPDGRVILTRPSERSATPLRLVVCAANPKPRIGGYLGKTCGTLNIKPKYDAAGRLESVFQLDGATFDMKPR
jgi:hypothetical protein